jgi:hypothetical protein
VELRGANRIRARLTAAGLGVLLALLVLAAPAGASSLKVPREFYTPPGGYGLSSQKVIKIADRTEKARSEKRKRGRLVAAAYTNGPGRWQVSYWQGRKEVVQVAIDDATGAVLEQWTGPQVPWRMARGYEGQFGRKLNAPYIFIPLCALFLLPFFDPRRPLRMVHLDLLALLAFAASHIYFNKGDIATSVPLAYPPMLYLLARMLWVGFRPRERPQKLVPFAPLLVLSLGLLFLVGFRVALNIADGQVIDVGYAGTVGADRIADGDQLYGGWPKGIEKGDTYGPINYLAYVPWEQLMPWKGRWDDLPSAHAAALTFDLLTVLGLLVLGRRLRAGPEGKLLGVALAYAWAAYPYSTFVLQSNANDSLVAALVVWALIFLRSPVRRGAIMGLAAAAKFTPIVLAPLFATATGERRWRNGAIASAALVAVVLISFVPWIPDGGLSELYDRTLGYQAGRNSPFSIWGQHPGLEWLHVVALAFAGLLALAVAFVPRRKLPMQIAALAAAVMIAIELTADHWFYLYIVWFAPLVLIAAFLPLRTDREPGPLGPPRDAELATEAPLEEPLTIGSLEEPLNSPVRAAARSPWHGRRRRPRSVRP